MNNLVKNVLYKKASMIQIEMKPMSFKYFQYFWKRVLKPVNDDERGAGFTQ